MATNLEIVWDGIAPGLPDHRLSVGAFGPAIGQLLGTIRRVASDIEMRARGPVRDGGRGRLARDAAILDVQIVSITGNSPLHLSAVVLPLEIPARPLIADLPDVAVDEFLLHLEREANGAPAHYYVRKFLRSLPEGVSDQRYVHRRTDGSVVREVKIGAVNLAAAPQLPHLVEIDGTLVGFGFENGRTEIKVRAASGELLSIAATPPEVERALELRLTDVRVLAVAEAKGRMRLLRLGNDRPREFSRTERSDYLFRNWDALLNQLAK